MEKLIFIKYYYTSNEIEQMFEEMQVIVEDKIEEMFGETQVYFYFIDASLSAYNCDIIEVEHNFSLTKEEKDKIFTLVDENVYFVENMDEETKEYLADLYDKKHFLTYAKFTFIKDQDILKKSQPL